MKQPRRQPKKLAPPRKAPRERTSQFEPFARLDKLTVVFAIFSFCLLHWAARVMIAPVYTIEEADQLLFSQSLQIGYEAREPPMLAWLYALAILGGGISGPIIFGVKYLLLFAALAFYYLAARNVLIKPGVSAAAVGAWALTFQVGWGMHEDLLGAVGMMACLSLSLHAFTRILTWRRYRDWIYLGVTIGLGLLTHHLYLVFPVAMLLAVFLSPFFRDAMNIRRLAVAVIVAMLIYGPYAVWVLTHIGSIADAARDYTASWEIDSAWFDRAGIGAISLARTLLEFTLPLSLFWLMLFWNLWLPVLYPVFSRRSTDEEPHETAWRRVLARSMLFSAVSYLFGVVFGVQVYHGYWVLPVLFVMPIWMFAHVKRAGDFPVAIRAFGGVAMVFALAVFGGRFIEWRAEIIGCNEGGCRPYAPISDWAIELKKAGFSQGTIVGADKHLTGNLRGAFPRARVLDASIQPGAFPQAKTNGACLAVWRDETVMPEALAAYLTNKLGAPPRDMGPEGAIRRNLRLSEDKAATLYLQFVPPSEACR